MDFDHQKNEPTASDPERLANNAHSTPLKRPTRRLFGKGRQRLFFSATILIIVCLLASYWIKGASGHANPVPKSIKQSVDFPVYYPRQDKLPMDYKLDSDSFVKLTADVVSYSVSSASDRLVFTVQKKPSDNEINSFNSQRIPIHIEFNTSVGKAEMGVIGKQTVVSLPTTDKSWIIITGPEKIDQNKLEKVLKSLQKPD
jgi:hypothetical protein